MIEIKQLCFASAQPRVAQPHRQVRMSVFGKLLATMLLIGATGVLAGELETPACSDPAKLEGHPDPKAPGVFIAFKHGVDSNAAATMLAKKYHFNIANQYSWGTIFSRDFNLNLLSSVRCERDVDFVEFNAIATTGNVSRVYLPWRRS